MNINFNQLYTARIQVLLIGLGIIFGLFSLPGQAEPYLAIKNNMQCSSCHVNPIGGGARNAFGNLYGHNQLPANASDITTAELGKINEFLSLGGNVRYNAEHTRDDADNKSSTFKVDSAQLYITVTPKDSGLTLYVDQQIAPGSAINREAFLLYRFSDNHYIKAGKMYVPFGLRLEDDTAFVRQVTGFNFDSSDNGVELGLQYGQSNINLFVTNGTSAVTNNDDKFMYGIRGEHLFRHFRLGATALVNSADENQQHMFNLYAGANFGDVTLLGELDWIKTEADSQVDNGQDVNQVVALVEINYQWQPGLNLKFTSEYFDPDDNINENHETRFSLVAEYTPISNLQLRLGIRSSEGIPQQPQRSSEKFFLQTHVYF